MDKNRPEIMSNTQLMKRLFVYMKGYIGKYILALVLMGLLVICDLVIPYFTGLSLKYLGEDPIVFRKILFLAITSLGIIALICILQYIQTMLLNITGNKIVLKIREDVLIHIQSLSHEQFNNNPIGKLVTRATSDVNVLFNLYTNILISLVRNIATIIGVIVAMFLLNTKLATILLIIMPFIAVFSYIFRKYLRKIHRKVRDNISSMNAFISEDIAGMKISQIFNQEEKRYQMFAKSNADLKKSLLKEVFVFGIFRPSIYVMYLASVILVLWFGGNMALTLGPLVMSYDILFTFYQYISRLFNPIQALADQFNEIQASFASAEKIFTVLDLKPVIVDEEDAIDMKITGDIEFKDVWFSYIPGEWILKGVSFHIHKDETVAFVGATGSGKTTILSLIVRDYDIQKGQILLDGVDIKKIKVSCLRGQIGQMLQDVFLFTGTVLSNIQMNDENITFEEVQKAAVYVNASKFIDKLPKGYYEETKERGNNFSLGQRQLISFARTIVHKPQVMILDEATANIDTETESLIQDSLEKIMKHGTVIVVAHRLSTIQYADTIYVFSNGELIESGNHQELLHKQGRYYKLYQLQFAEDE